VAWGSSHVVARGSSHVEAWESSHVEASKLVAIHRHDKRATITGGVLIDVERPTTPAEWCDYYGATVTDGVAVIYKALGADFKSGYGFEYAPGSTPIAPDWDDGRAECGGGLHFCSHPAEALQFHDDATRFVACPVALADMRAPRASDSSPNKIKARGCCGPVYEVDRHGKPVSALAETGGE
jgi:hypothetical protein